jgi:hypothetical protein
MSQPVGVMLVISDAQTLSADVAFTARIVFIRPCLYDPVAFHQNLKPAILTA